MIILKRFALISLLVSLLFVAACTAESEPAMTETAVATPITEPTPIPELLDLPSPTPASDPIVEPNLTETVVPTQDVDAYSTALQLGLIGRDFDFLLSQMSDPFGFGPYRSEWSLLTPAEMVVQLENILPQGAALQFNPEADLIAMLDGQDPQMMLGPDVTVAAAWHSSGWGAEGRDEAILFIEEMGDGRFAWKAMIIAPNGFLPESAELPILDEQPAPVGLLYSQPDGSLWQVGADGQPEQIWFQEGIMPTPAPDGQHAFFQVQGDLWLLDVATGESRALTMDHDDQGTHLAGFHWWYNNDTILTGIWLDLETEGGPNLGHPALVDIATGEVTMLDDQHLMSSHPAISADGALAYSTVGKSAVDTELTWIYRPESGVMAFNPADFSNVSEGSYTSPSWSADGRFLAWLTFTGDNMNHLALFDLESGSAANLPSYQGVGFGGPYPNPVISPDPNWIALRQFTVDEAIMGLWLYTQDGQEPLFIAQNGGESLWLNDHLLLFIDYDENFNAQLQQYDALTGTRSVVTLPDVFQIFSIVER